VIPSASRPAASVIAVRIAQNPQARSSPPPADYTF
jgi:hypothetical protein